MNLIWWTFGSDSIVVWYDLDTQHWSKVRYDLESDIDNPLASTGGTKLSSDMAAMLAVKPNSFPQWSWEGGKVFYIHLPGAIYDFSGSFIETCFVPEQKLLDPQVDTDLNTGGKRDIYAAAVVLGEDMAPVYPHYSKFCVEQT